MRCTSSLIMLNFEKDMSNLVNFLKQSDIFYSFTPTQLELVANLCQEVVFDADEPCDFS
jgi:hypothetical protein